MCECFFVFGRSILKHCHWILCFVTRFRQLLFIFVGHSSWTRDSKSNFVYWHSFSSKFQSKSSPRCKGPITPDEFEWQNIEFVWKNDEFDHCIRNSLSDTSVASFLVLGGQDPQMYRQKKSNLYARAPQKHIFSGLQIHLHVQSMQFPFYYLWHCAV